MMIQGKSCTLTVAKDGNYYPLPYTEETIRQASKGYALPGVIGERNREKLVSTGVSILGCFVTLLEYQNVLPLFLLLFRPDDKFDILTDRIAEKLIYKNLGTLNFELRANNKEPFYIRLNVKENEDSYITDWDRLTPNLKWKSQRTFVYNGHKVTKDDSLLPLVYRFELNGFFSEKSNYQIKIFFPLTPEHYPTQKRISNLKIIIDEEYGINLELDNLQPVGDMTDINCGDTVLCFQLYNILGNIILTIANDNLTTRVVL